MIAGYNELETRIFIMLMVAGFVALVYVAGMITVLMILRYSYG